MVKKLSWGTLAVVINMLLLNSAFADVLPIQGSVRELVQAGNISNSSSCAITTSNDLYCWGKMGPDKTSDLPVYVMDDVKSVASTGNRSCAVKNTGELYCWGKNVGNGTENIYTTPVKILDDVDSVYLENDYCCALKTSGELYCAGQVAGLTNVKLSPEIIIDGVSSVDVGRNLCVIKKTNELYCMGRLSKNLVQYIPYKLLDNVKQVKGNCALTTSNVLYCWGDGVIGNGNRAEDSQSNASWIMDNVSSFGSDYAIKKTGELYRWGNNYQGQVGNGVKNEYETRPVKILDNVSFVESTCAITTAGDLYCWGNNQNGRLGSGNSTNEIERAPVKIMENAASISVGPVTMCAIQTSGELFCWGGNNFGSVGCGDRCGKSITQPFEILDDVSYVTNKCNDTCAIKDSGEVLCWGRFKFGRAKKNFLSEPLQIFDGRGSAPVFKTDCNDHWNKENLNKNCSYGSDEACKEAGVYACYGAGDNSSVVCSVPDTDDDNTPDCLDECPNDSKNITKPRAGCVIDESKIPERYNPNATATGTVTPNTQLLRPFVVAKRKKIFIYLERFADASFKDLDATLKDDDDAVKYKYELLIAEKAVNKDEAFSKKFLKRNSFNLKRKKSSTYTIKYRISVIQGRRKKKTKWSNPVKVTKFRR